VPYARDSHMAVATVTPDAPILFVQKAFKHAYISSSMREEDRDLHHTNFFQFGRFIRGKFLKPTMIFQLGFFYVIRAWEVKNTFKQGPCLHR
jgi:hypothetical protein